MCYVHWVDELLLRGSFFSVALQAGVWGDYGLGYGMHVAGGFQVSLI